MYNNTKKTHKFAKRLAAANIKTEISWTLDNK